jgi:hypothetical protein
MSNIRELGISDINNQYNKNNKRTGQNIWGRIPENRLMRLLFYKYKLKWKISERIVIKVEYLPIFVTETGNQLNP